MNYLKWSQEYYEEAQKVMRNIGILREKLRNCPMDERRTTERNIQMLRGMYYECIETAAYLQKLSKEKSDAA